MLSSAFLAGTGEPESAAAGRGETLTPLTPALEVRINKEMNLVAGARKAKQEQASLEGKEGLARQRSHGTTRVQYVTSAHRCAG